MTIGLGVPASTDQLLREVLDLATEAERLKNIGDKDGALELYRRANVLARAGLATLDLQDKKSLSNVHSMTKAQLKRRGRAIAIGRGKGNPFLARLAEKGWTQGEYAKKLGITAGSLVAYRIGRPVPKVIARAIKRDLGFGDEFWPGGTVD